jgi:hypothetical protein
MAEPMRGEGVFRDCCAGVVGRRRFSPEDIPDASMPVRRQHAAQMIRATGSMG